MALKKDKINEILTGLVIISSISLRNIPYLLYIIQLMFIIFSGTYYLKKVNREYLINRIILIIFIFGSCLWCYSFEYFTKVLLSTIQIFVITILLFGYIDSKNKINNIIKYVIIAGAIMVMNLLISTPISEWHSIIYYSSNAIVDVASSQGRLGRSISMHPNEFACSALICLLCCFYKLLNSKNKKKLYFILFITLTFLLILSKSRSTLIEMILGFAIVFIFNEKKGYKKFFYTFLCIFFVIMSFYALIKIPILYEVVGYRMEGLLDVFFTSGNNVDASTTARLGFVKIGIDIVKDYPILGIGMNNFAIYAYNFYNTWGAVYAHNNYIEILCDLGIVGAILYYGIWIKAFLILAKLRKKLRKNAEEYKLISFLLALFLILLIIEFSHITYDNECFQYMITTIIASAFLYKKKLNNLVVVENEK